VALVLPSGEQLTGATLNYNRDGSGVFVYPFESDFGVERIFVTPHGIHQLRLLSRHNSQLPTPNSQPLPTPNALALTTTYVVDITTPLGDDVRLPKLSKLEHQIMEALWNRGAASVRQILEAFPDKGGPAYTTVQTMVYRLEEKGAVRRVKKIGNAHIFEAVISRASAQRRLIDDLLAFFGGSSQPVVAHLIESGNLTLDDVKEAEQLLRRLKSGKSGRSGKVSSR
jgi:predicted transcriptional regulator